MDYLTTGTSNLVTDLLQSTSKDVLRAWVDLTDKEKVTASSNLYIAASFVQRTLYHQISQILDDQYQLRPLDCITIVNQISVQKNKVEFDQYCTKNNINTKQFKFSEIKPYAQNGLDVLQKTYLCLTFDNAYEYVQTAKTIGNLDTKAMAKDISALQLAHDNLASILIWYRLARRFSESYFVTDQDEFLKNYQNETELYPSLEQVEVNLQLTISVIRKLNIFPEIILKTLLNSEDLTSFFINVDALLLALTTKHSEDELIIRKKVAYLYLIRDYISDTADWLMVKYP